jgi:nucleoside 2-deoxyribosyltransferase
MRPLVYLAGPDVFLPEPHERARRMKEICVRHGLDAVSPLDPLRGEAFEAPGDPRVIASRNEMHIRHSAAILANLTPFRGPGADPGTVYEVGYGRALGRPVFGYATVAADYAARVRLLPGSSRARDAAGLEIEDFGLFENLMISCGIEASGGFLLARDAVGGWSDLSVFEACVIRAADALSTTQTLPVLPLPLGAGRGEGSAHGTG